MVRDHFTQNRKEHSLATMLQMLVEQHPFSVSRIDIAASNWKNQARPELVDMQIKRLREILPDPVRLYTMGATGRIVLLPKQEEGEWILLPEDREASRVLHPEVISLGQWRSEYRVRESTLKAREVPATLGFLDILLARWPDTVSDEEIGESAGLFEPSTLKHRLNIEVTRLRTMLNTYEEERFSVNRKINQGYELVKE